MGPQLESKAAFWFALTKVVTILVLIAIWAILLVIGFKTDAGTVTFSNIGAHGGISKRGFGFLLSFQKLPFTNPNRF
ncbi:hypothetical protein GCM10010912_53750 [Paenibacillus albidus]|uniref:Uncharacterized protein n=1 Tax=Paenibacillus albidus TaxID=2041023 RepID=A0A917CY69_9BACL|nr:hypothetical protein GCM10010912_53750 [Paenibacillus albidus]